MRGIMHRDIKVSNILLNNEGVLKIGDFGLANTINTNGKHHLTSRVVTLWYRPPELLMGSTNYGVSVDLWSVGCVFAELFLGKPILKGRTEVILMINVFNLCYVVLLFTNVELWRCTHFILFEILGWKLMCLAWICCKLKLEQIRTIQTAQTMQSFIPYTNSQIYFCTLTRYMFFFSWVYRLNNYTKFLSCVVLLLRTSGKRLGFLMQQCLNLRLIMKALFGRGVQIFLHLL